VTWAISKDFEFSASHHLHGLPENHQCARLHGHNFKVRVEVSGQYLQDPGFLIDYGEFAPFKAYIDSVLDHRDLNDVMDLNPTAEHLAATLHAAFLRLIELPQDATVAMGISETPKTWAWFRP
jgi:6-pyruvoyltetrahydropterin/6-carboxytetrahydropterin synthase